MITDLKKIYGNKCTGVKINYEGTYVNVNKSTIKIRFCEAVSYSFNNPLLLNSKNLLCKGSQRSFGILKTEEKLISHISEENRISISTIKKALQDIPAFDKPVNNIFLGIQNEMESEIYPDLYILHIKPKDAMLLIKQYIIKTNTFPIISSYPFLSVCGNIVAATFNQKEMCISFGCPESRTFGGVHDNHVIVGLPYNICNKLIN